MLEKKPQIESPSKEKPPRITAQEKEAGGIPAIWSSMVHTFSETGVIRGTKTLLRLNQSDGFDCPGCAWPDPDHRSMVEFCENGAKALAEEATLKRVTPEFFANNSIYDLSKQSDYFIGKLGRLTHPMIKKADATHYEPISWDEAFKLMGNTLNSLKSPDEATFYTSGRTSNEAAFLYQLFVRMFGTNNLPDCSNMCHESSGAALMESIGVGKGSVTLDDFDHADCILIMGQNPGTNHPRMLSSLLKAAQNGCKIISINPLKEAGLGRFKHPQEVFSLLGHGTALATDWLQVKINGDVALLKGLMKELLRLDEEQKIFDHDFIKNYTHGFDEFIQDLKSTSWDVIVKESGIQKTQIEEVAKVIASSKKMIICWAMGLTQHKNAVANIQEAVNLLLLGGHFGRKGAGACPVRGHSNVQGDRTMGIWEKMPDSFLESLEKEFGFSPPKAHGLDTVQSIHAMVEGRVKVFIGMGGNFLSATPDTKLVAEALEKCQLTVQVSTKLNRSHLVTGKTALMLPCLGRTEKDQQESGLQKVTMENSMGIVHSSQGNLVPASEYLKSEVAIVVGLAKAVFKDSKINWDAFLNYHHVRDSISRVIPGFEDYNDKIKNPNGFYLPHAVRDKLVFNTKTKKANFTVHEIPKSDLKDGQYLLMTLRSHDQFNTTIYGLDDRYRGIHQGRRVIFMNANDMAKEKLNAGSYVDITSHFDSETREVLNFMVVAYDIPEGSMATYFPEANPLVPIKSVAHISNTPAYKSVVVSIKPSALF